jgi:hypothetical protein
LDAVCNGQVATSIIFFFPYVYPVDQDNMNWTVVVVAATVVVAGLNWILVARHTFKGPKRVDSVLDPTAPASTDQEVACPVIIVPGASCAGQGLDPEAAVCASQVSVYAGSA